MKDSTFSFRGFNIQGFAFQEKARNISRGWKIAYELAKKDLKSRYLGSYLGFMWAFIQPLINILIFWFVFQIGFKSAPIDKFPFILWLVTGMIPWFFFSDSLLGGTNSVLDHAYLVKKVVFQVSIIPVIRIMAALFIHLFFIAFLILLFWVYGYQPNPYNLQILYYSVAMVILVLALSLITSSLIIFFRDFGQIVAMLLQFGFWLTPIMWSFKMLPAKYIVFFKLNPVYYLVEGYRDSFIYHQWFWEHLNLTLGFWLITLTLFVIGVQLFRKLKPHFADVL